ncbi:MAG: F0F1 ATP synthase subunit B [Rhodoluna sp.]|nr:F0F1 ATP synthase subunit B [Rhodoluna sp.]MBP6186612.1 F0F1 ATP synthase subunit B [Rhodoluna sp.]
MISRILAAAAAEGETHNPLIPAVYDLVWSSVVFAILLVFFWFKVLPNFKKTLDARTEAIEGRLEAAEKAQAEAAAKTANIEAEQSAARAEASQIREEARAEAAAIGAEIKETAQAEAARLLAAAKSQIEAETQAALVSLRAEVGSLAVDLASSVVGESLKNDKLAANVVDSFLAELETKKK